MAVTKTKTLIEVRYVPPVENDMATAMPMADLVSGSYNLSIDDPDDDELPIVTMVHFQINQGDDISTHDPLVQTICNAVWSDE